MSKKTNEQSICQSNSKQVTASLRRATEQGASGIVGKFSKDNKHYIAKKAISRCTDPLVQEAIVMRTINTIIRENVDPSYNPFMTFECAMKNSNTKPVMVADAFKDTVTLHEYLVTEIDIKFNELYKSLTALFHSMYWMHEKCGFVHNDLHVGNILINSKTMQLYLIDYGRSYVTDLYDTLEKQIAEEPLSILVNTTNTKSVTSYRNEFTKETTHGFWGDIGGLVLYLARLYPGFRQAFNMLNISLGLKFLKEMQDTVLTVDYKNSALSSQSFNQLEPILKGIIYDVLYITLNNFIYEQSQTSFKIYTNSLFSEFETDLSELHSMRKEFVDALSSGKNDPETPPAPSLFFVSGIPWPNTFVETFGTNFLQMLFDEFEKRLESSWAAGGNKSVKRQIKYNSCQRKVYIDPSKQKYIRIDNKRVYLSTIRGKYRYVK